MKQQDRAVNMNALSPAVRLFFRAAGGRRSPRPRHMRTTAVAAALVVAGIGAAATQDVDINKPEWAYAVALTAPQPRPVAPGEQRGRGAGRGAPDPTPRTLPGSKFSFTTAQVRNNFDPADWFPEDHPAMPDIVAHGRAPDVKACAFCHMPNGKGRPENAPVAGLPEDYIVRQLEEFKAGLRKTGEPRKPNDMGQITATMTKAEMQAAASYFASMRGTPWITVVETDVVKKTRIAGQMFHLVEDGTTEPIGNRIVEAPEDEAAEQLRSPRSGFVAYVPVGAIKRGAELVATGGSKVISCTVCHGADLRGLGPVPPLAGRSPSYLARQMYDFRQGARTGIWAPLMRPIAENLTSEDLVNIFAYTASRPQ
jgi:cytochrome c553